MRPRTFARTANLRLWASGQPKASVTKLLTENAVLLEEVLDHLVLATIDPAETQNWKTRAFMPAG